MCMHVYFWHYIIFKIMSAIYVWLICPTENNLKALSCSWFVEELVWWQYSILVFLVMGTLKSVKDAYKRILI